MGNLRVVTDLLLGFLAERTLTMDLLIISERVTAHAYRLQISQPPLPENLKRQIDLLTAPPTLHIGDLIRLIPFLNLLLQRMRMMDSALVKSNRNYQPQHLPRGRLKKNRTVL